MVSSSLETNSERLKTYHHTGTERCGRWDGGGSRTRAATPSVDMRSRRVTVAVLAATMAAVLCHVEAGLVIQFAVHFSHLHWQVSSVWTNECFTERCIKKERVWTEVHGHPCSGAQSKIDTHDAA